ncbi:glycine zipper domain-containing protein [Vibrio sp. DNB22_17_1]
MLKIATAPMSAVTISKSNEKREIVIKPSTEGALKGAATGVMIGRAFGPAGMAVGAGVGGVLGYVLGEGD